MMGKRKTFKAIREPQHLVLTKWEPEDIGPLELKFRDLHVIRSVMVDYTATYIRAIEDEHERCGTAIDLNAPVTPRTRDLENLIRIMFSAYLATFSSIMSYMRSAAPEVGKQWLDDCIKTRTPLAAFERLRNLDVHQEPLHTLIGIRYQVIGFAPMYSSIATHEIHQHYELGHQGIGFYPPPLADTERFKPHPGLVQFVTFEPATELAHTGIHAIIDLVRDASGLGYITDEAPDWRCGVCADAAMT